jgi:hypothetical protein
LNYATFSYNNAVHLATNHSPHSFYIKLPTSVTHGQPSYNYDSYKRELQIQLRNTQTLAKESISHQKELNKKYYDRKVNPIQLKVNDLQK